MVTNLTLPLRIIKNSFTFERKNMFITDINISIHLLRCNNTKGNCDMKINQVTISFLLVNTNSRMLLILPISFLSVYSLISL